MRLLLIVALLVLAAIVLDVPALAWIAFGVALLGLAVSSVFGLFVLLVLAVLLFAATRHPENRR